MAPPQANAQGSTIQPAAVANHQLRDVSGQGPAATHGFRTAMSIIRARLTAARSDELLMEGRLVSS